jgi:hypothetical protein
MGITEVRRAAVLAAVVFLAAVSLSACGGGEARGVHTSTTAASLSNAVFAGRFTRTVQLDNGVLRVQPAPANLHPVIPENAAATKIWGSARLENFEALALGFGLVTITIRRSGVPVVLALPAWIGFAKAGPILCPLEQGAAPRVLPPSNGLAAVVIGGKDGLPAVVYSARTSECGLPPSGPSVAVADEVLSLAWSPVSPLRDGSLTVRYFQPTCARAESQSESGNPTSTTLTIEVEVPDMPEKCLPGHYVVTSVPMLPSASSVPLVDHGRVGVVREVHFS